MIDFVRQYDFYGETVYNVLYKPSYRVNTYFGYSNLPKTVKAWLNDPNRRKTTQYDKTSHRYEIIYD